MPILMGAMGCAECCDDGSNPGCMSGISCNFILSIRCAACPCLNVDMTFIAPAPCTTVAGHACPSGFGFDYVTEDGFATLVTTGGGHFSLFLEFAGQCTGGGGTWVQRFAVTDADAILWDCTLQTWTWNLTILDGDNPPSRTFSFPCTHPWMPLDCIGQTIVVTLTRIP